MDGKNGFDEAEFGIDSETIGGIERGHRLADPAGRRE